MVEIIRKLCNEKGTNIRKLEQSVGFGNGTIARWDKNSPSVDKVQKVADALGVSISVILDGEDQDAETRDNDIKFALFGDVDVDDEIYNEVKRFAKFAQSQAKKVKP